MIGRMKLLSFPLAAALLLAGNGCTTSASVAPESSPNGDTPPPTVIDAGVVSVPPAVDAPAEHIPVTRAACNPFGDNPAPVEPFFDALWGPTCIGQGGQKMDSWQDSDGNARQSCLYLPRSASTANKLPLVVYLHPSLVGPDLSLPITNVREQLNTADLTGDPNRPGFIMVAPYGRVTGRYYPLPDQGLTVGWDNWYRQMDPNGRTIDGTAYAENVDAATIDHYLNEVIASGMVDTSRIYVMGWSNGSAMATLYVLNRPQIASAAIYSSPDPFQAFNDPCPQDPITAFPKDDTQLELFNPNVPMYQVHNDCDIAGLCPNSNFLAQTLATNQADNMTMQMIDSLEASTNTCLDICGTDPSANYAGIDDLTGYLESLPGYSLGTVNHLRWPDLWTSAMFEFLRDHPLPQ